MRRQSGTIRDKLVEAADNASALVDSVGWPKTHDERFHEHLLGPSGSLNEIVSAADERGVSVGQVRRAYRALVSGDRHLTSHEDVMARTGMDYHEARQSAAVLSDLGDIHECYDDDWNLWWARCDEYIKDKCEKRRISLWRYFEMYDLLSEFQDLTVSWYVRRNRRQSQPFNLTELKERYVHEIQEEHFPDKPVGEEWSRHIAARYIRTAHDSIIRSMNLTY